MASGLAVREPGESRVLSGQAAKAQGSINRNSTGQGSTDRSQVGRNDGVLVGRLAPIVQVLTGLGRPAGTMSSNVPLLHAATRSVPVVQDPPASRSGPADRVTRAQRSDPARGQHLAHGHNPVHGRSLALVRDRRTARVRGLLPGDRPAEAAAVRGHLLGDSAKRVKKRPGSRTEAVHAAAGARVERDVLNASFMRVTQGFGSVARINSARESFHTAATVCVPCPRVASEIGNSMKRAFGMRFTILSAMPSSGGLM